HRTAPDVGAGSAFAPATGGRRKGRARGSPEAASRGPGGGGLGARGARLRSGTNVKALPADHTAGTKPAKPMSSGASPGAAAITARSTAAPTCSGSLGRSKRANPPPAEGATWQAPGPTVAPRP